VLAQGCALSLAVRPPDLDPGVRPVRCSQSRVAPAVDAAIAAGLVAAIAAGAAGGGDGPIPVVAATFAISAATGYHGQARCRAMNRRPVALSAPAITVGGHAGTSSGLLIDDLGATEPEPTIDDDPTPGRPVERLPERVSDVHPSHPPKQVMRLGDAVVMRAVDALRPAFLRCFQRAMDKDPMRVLPSMKVTVHVDVDPTGAVTAAQSDAPSPVLAKCLTAIARRLVFPSPDRPAAADVPFHFRAGS
jgi:hypothetical protein